MPTPQSFLRLSRGLSMTLRWRKIRIVGTLLALLLFHSDAVKANICVSERLKPLRHFCGKVVDSDGELIPNVKVSVLRDGRELFTETTSADGAFDFNLIQAGEYEVHAEATGFVKMIFRFKLSR